MDHIQDELKKFESHAVRVLRLPIQHKEWVTDVVEFQNKDTQLAWIGWLGKARSSDSLPGTLAVYCKNNPEEHTRLQIEEDGYTCLDCPERWYVTRDRRSQIRQQPKHFLDSDYPQKAERS